MIVINRTSLALILGLAFASYAQAQSSYLQIFARDLIQAQTDIQIILQTQLPTPDSPPNSPDALRLAISKYQSASTRLGSSGLKFIQTQQALEQGQVSLAQIKQASACMEANVGLVDLGLANHHARSAGPALNDPSFLADMQELLLSLQNERSLVCDQE